MTEVEFREHSSVRLIRAQADDDMIADDARLSTRQFGGYHENQAEDKRVAGLVRSLMREHHGTPFEAPQFVFEIEAPIFVAREAHRHRIASISEMSGRYVELQPVFWVPPRDRPLVQVGKAMEYRLEPGDDVQYRNALARIKALSNEAWHDYQTLIAEGVAKEVARVVLPVNVFTKWRLRINLRSALNFLQLRTRDETATFVSKPMLEIEEVAREMEEYIRGRCPAAYAAFNEFGRVAP